MSLNCFGKNKDHSQPSEVSGVKYYGLVNQGATCSLNSVLQVLYMNQDFRERITIHSRNDLETKHIDRELKDLFLKLEIDVAFTNNITNKLEIYNVRVQRDAAELYEKILRQTSPEASQMFHGKLTNRNTCQECHKTTESESGFWLLPLSLSNNEDYSVERGILDFFRPSDISGDDQMFCETCDDKRDAVLKTEITHPPEVLVLLLKCFDFDQTCKKYLNSSVDVPMVLNVSSQTYELRAIVEHMGGISRYKATIRSHIDGRWYTFNDRYVTLSTNQYFQYGPTERLFSAYLLFYQKRKDSYHGLLNLGATCYLNSILQVLFRTAAFRESVNNYVQNNPGTENIDHELTDLFCELKGHWAYTYNIIKKLKIDNVFEQRDAAENYEKILRHTSPEASQIFHGELENISKCQDCEEEYKSTAGFWHLPLSLVDSADGCSVPSGLQDFFQSESEVQMYCEKCCKTCNAHTHCSLRLCPEVLVLLMKRFEYDYRRKRYVKNNCAVEVPYSLAIEPTHMYELYACVEHSGDLTYGHYISKIKDDGRWYIFNDLSVTPSIVQEKPTEISETAYLLFYRRKTDSVNRDVSTARTPQEENAIAEQNAKDNEKEREDETQDNIEKGPADHEGSPHSGISENSYHGLLNLGATCYLNSILQVLFRTAAFRESVNNYVQNNPGTENIDHELTDLFCELKGHWAYTYNIIKKLKIDNVFEQRDAAENYEKILRQTSPEASQIFHGELENISKCQDCEEEYKSTTGFWHLPLSLVDSADGCSVPSGLQDLLQRESEVQMYCEKCCKTCNAHTHCSLRLFPEVLVLLMKRFEYDYRRKRYVKNNCAVEVPYSLAIEPTHMYELYACVEHSGDLTYGHYISKIKDDGRWYIFNDLSVTPCIVQEKPTEISETAYLLFYRRKTDSVNRDVSTARTPQEENAIAEQNAKDNKKEREDGTQDNIEKGPADHEGSPHSGISESNETCHSNLDKLVDSFDRLTIIDSKDSIVSQVDDSQMDVFNMDEMKEEEAHSDKLTLHNESRPDPYIAPANYLDQQFDQQYEEGSYIGAQALAEVGNIRAFESLMDMGDDRDGDEDRCGKLLDDTYSFLESGDKLKMTLRVKESGTRDEPERMADREYSQASATDEVYLRRQPYNIHYPDNEEFKKVKAVMMFITEENVQVSGATSLPPENKFRFQSGSDISQQQESIREEQRTSSSEPRFVGVESLGVTESGDTEIHRYIPKKRQDTDK